MVAVGRFSTLGVQFTLHTVYGTVETIAGLLARQKGRHNCSHPGNPDIGIPPNQVEGVDIVARVRVCPSLLPVEMTDTPGTVQYSVRYE